MKRLLLCLLLLVVSAVSHPGGAGPKLVVLNKEDATLVTVDPATGRILGTVPTGDGPHEVTVSDDGTTAVVGNYGGAQGPGNTLSVIDHFLAGLPALWCLSLYRGQLYGWLGGQHLYQAHRSHASAPTRINSRRILP